MSFTDNYLKLRKKREEEEEEEKKQSKGNSFTEEYSRLKSQQEDDDIAPVVDNSYKNHFGLVTQALTSGGNTTLLDEDSPEYKAQQLLLDMKFILGEAADPIVRAGKSQTLVKSGAFSDGYDFGDVSLSILGTAGDAALEAVKGFGKVGEGFGKGVAYGIAGVADAFGADDWAEGVRDRAERDFIDEWTEGIDSGLEKYSFLGSTTDSFVEGLGQAAAIAATGGAAGLAGLGAAGVTAVTTGTTFMNSFGHSTSEAYRNGATDEEAYKYGLMAGSADAISELLFGGMGKAVNAVGWSKGLSSLDDMAASAVGKFFKSDTGKNVAQFAVKSAFEGGEEVIAGFGQALAKKATYMSEEDFEDILRDENLFEQFVFGTLTSAAMQSGILPGTSNGSLIDSNKTGRDFISGLSSNEQSVVDKVFKDELAKAEENGKVTNKQKNEIYNEVLERMEKGRIDTDTIEEVLGGDSFKAYKDILDSENALKEEQKALQEEQKALEEEYKQINPKNIRDMTGEEWDRREEIKARLSEIETKLNEIGTNLGDAQTNAQRNALKAQLDKDVYELTKGDRLRESFFEVVRAKQKYQADLSQYKGRAKKVIQSVMESGLADNTNETHDFWDSMANMAEAMDTDITLADDAQILEMVKAEYKADGLEFDESKFKEQRIDGYISKNGIVLNAKTKRSLSFVVGHEITHKLEKTKHYAKLQKLLFEYAKDEYESRFNERSGQYSNKFKADDKYKAKVDKEVTGDLVGGYVFNDKGFIDHLAKDRNVFQRVWDEIKYMAKIVKAGSEQAKQLERVKREFERAYREANKAQSGDTKYSISETTDGRRVAVVDNDILSKIDTSTWDKTTKKEAKKAASEELKKFSDGFTINGIEFIGNSDSRREYTRSDYSEALARKNPTAYLDKMRAAAVLDDVIQVATDWNNDNELTHDREDYVDFVRGKTLIMSGDRAYRAIVLAGITSDGRAIFHDLEDIYPDSFELKKSESSTAVSANESPNRILEDSDAATVAQKDSDVKMQFSVSDSDGKRLSKGQQEYFKDSKMRDENGNLKVMYHGSQDAGFHVFDSSMSDDGTSFFFVDRNDVAASYSGTTETYAPRVWKSAEDANNFFKEMGFFGGSYGYEVVENDGNFTLLNGDDEIATSDNLAEIYEEFCDYEGVGYGDANYKVYLNLTNPLVVDAEGRNWDNVTREFSQEMADKYNSLTAEEKAALSNLASWEDVGIFRDEIRQALADTETGAPGTYDEAFAKNVRSAYEKLGGNKVNMYDLFSIAEDNFSDLAIEAWAVKQMNTRDYAQKAKAEGYDGVIFNNIHDNGGYSNGSEGASTVAIAFNSNQIKSVANEMPTGDADIRYSVSEAQNEKGLNREQEVSFSLSNDTAYMDKAIAKNESNKGYAYHVDTRRMEEAKAVRERIAARMNEIKEKGLVGLPEDIEGNTYITNSSYDGTEENTTICPRSLASEAFVDAVSEYLGRPLSVEEQIYISQDLQGRSLTPECTYCYVATDRKAYRAFLGEYIKQRDAVLEKLKANPNADVSRSGKLYEEFRNGRKDTNPMYSRFKMWADAFKNGTPMVEASHLANINKLMGDINSEFGEALKPQIVDAMKYAQSASWAKKRVNYVAYNGHILNWKQDRINKLNSHYGLRMYSFSDFHPAFVLENMQMITDASVRGLKMLGYTKDTDFVDIFAPSGMNINVSTFGFESSGEVYENNIIGAEWAKAKALREQYPNVGITFVATNDTLVNWALEQDWIDVVIPYHLVRTGAEVAKAFNYTNYTSESSDLKDAGWTKGDKKYIAPTEHNNDKATYLAALAKNHLKPRFERFIDNPNYMKLVNECRQPASMSKPVQPIFNEDAANSALSKLEANGYYQPIGGSVDRMYEIAAEVAEGMTRELAPAMSISDEGQQHKDTGGYQYYSHIPGEDIAPVQEDAAPIIEKPAKVMTEAEAVAPYEDNWKDAFDALVEEDAPPHSGKTTKQAAPGTRKALHQGIVDNMKSAFAKRGFDFDRVLKNAKNLSTFATVDNTPQRVMEKALGYKEGGVLADLTVNQVAQNETEGIKWLNSYTDRKNGVLAQISKQYSIKPGSKESAAAQMYAEGFYVDEKNNIVQYGDAELAKDFPDVKVQRNIKGLAGDPRIRQIYDDTLAMINESRTRNAYPEIPRLDNYFLHFRAMEDTFSRLGLPFNPNDIRAKDLPTDLNGVTADLKPGQPYFASAMHRTGKRTSFDLLGGLEKYLSSAKNQIYHIDDIQTLRALRNYVADTYGQANGLEGLDALSEEEAQDRIAKVYNSHLSTFAKFLNEEANILAGKTALIDRGLEGIIGRRGITFLDTVNKQVGSNMVGFNVSSSLTNFLPVVQTFAKTNKADFVRAFGQTVANKVGSVFGRSDSFTENSPVVIRRKGADRFYRTPYQKVGDAGYVLMSAVDDISTELIARTKYNELTRKGMDSQQAHYETDKWVSRLMGDRSLGQMPQLYNSKMLGLVTKFQLEVRNQLDSQFYDTIQEAKASNEDIQNGLARNAKTAAKVASTFVQLAVVQHLFGKAFESVAGYNPAFDIIEVLIKAFGWDDDEESEDTALDNIEQGFLALLEDLPYTGTFTGGRIPIESALPIEQFVTGKDKYGNDKSRWETIGEVAPYYILPGGYGQVKKTHQGLSMFDEDHPIAGSYTDSGNLRFPVEDTLGNRVQAGIFGQWASENAQAYFDNDISPLNEKQTQEFIDAGMTIQDYWKYRDGLRDFTKQDEKVDYINGLDLTNRQKDVLKSYLFDEAGYAEDNPEKYAFLESEGIGYLGYKQLDDKTQDAWSWAFNNQDKYRYLKENGVYPEDYSAYYIPMLEFDDEENEAYSWAFDNPEKATMGKVFGGGVKGYRKYASDLYNIKADKDSNGKSISGSRKEKVIDYINGLDADYGEKIILYKSEYPSDDTYNYDIIEYLNGREDISYEEMETILIELGFKVDSKGNITWD